MNKLLSVNSIAASYHKKEILHGVSMNVEREEIISIIGPNGAGKSTLLKVIAGLLIPAEGRVTFNDADITCLSPDKRTRKGIGYFMQGGEIFKNLKVIENLEMGGLILKNDFLKERFEDIFHLFPDLQDIRNKRAGLLSGGQRHMLALGIILINRPSLLLLDEPSAGLAPGLVSGVLEKVKEINKTMGTSIVLVEQNIKAALQVGDRIYVMKEGQIVEQGTPEMIKGIEYAFFH